jgi:glycosyltransferase involved in cell wall biosynthesis
MHRSGTSFLSRALNLSGVYLGDISKITTNDWVYNFDNLRGHWENKDLTELAEKTLKENNGSWDDPPTKIQISKEIEQHVIRYTTDLMVYPSLASGFKDPRLLLCLESWFNYLPKSSILIGIFRHPLEVAQSLKIRNGFSYEKSLKLWEIYNQKLLAHLDHHGGILLDFDWDKEYLFSEINTLNKKLGLLKTDFSDWFSENLLHSNKSFQSNYLLPNNIIELYNKLKEQSSQNSKYKLHFTIEHTVDNLRQIISSLNYDMKNQGNFFRDLNEKNLQQIKELSKQYSTIEQSLKSAIFDVDALQKINLNHLEDKVILQKSIQEKYSHLESLQKSIQEKDFTLESLQKSIQEKDFTLESLQKSIQEKDFTLESLQKSIQENNLEIQNLCLAVEAYQNIITEIHQSFVLRALHKYDRTIGKIFPLRPKRFTKAAKTYQTPMETKSITLRAKQTHDKKDIICFPITNWDFRFQRPQHILTKFAEKGHRVFCLTVNLRPLKTHYEIKQISNNIYQVELNSPQFFDIYKDKFDNSIVEKLVEFFEKFREDLEIDPILFIQFPTWAPLCKSLQEKYHHRIIFDCLDDFTGFSNVISARKNEETKLISSSDLVLATSSYLLKKVMSKTTKYLYLPNAGEFEHFKNKAKVGSLSKYKKPIIGYFGSISDWFDTDLIEHLASHRPQFTFIMIGHTFGADIRKLQKFPNVHFLGERPYSELPKYLHDFDVCLIPFKINPLIEATHPVKIYEYFAAGKPVIATKMTELYPMIDMCYLADTKEEFLRKLDLAINEKDETITKRRIKFASENTWNHRFDTLYNELKKNKLFDLEHHS